jgi:hypothetical protein
MRRRRSIIRTVMFLMLTLPLLLGGCSQTRPHFGSQCQAEYHGGA